MNVRVELEQMVDFLEETWSTSPRRTGDVRLLKELLETAENKLFSKEVDDLDNEVYNLKNKVLDLEDDLEWKNRRIRELESKVEDILAFLTEARSILTNTVDDAGSDFKPSPEECSDLNSKLNKAIKRAAEYR